MPAEQSCARGGACSLAGEERSYLLHSTRPGRPDQRIFPRYLLTVFYEKGFLTISHVFSDNDNNEVMQESICQWLTQL